MVQPGPKHIGAPRYRLWREKVAANGDVRAARRIIDSQNGNCAECRQELSVPDTVIVDGRAICDIHVSAKLFQ